MQLKSINALLDDLNMVKQKLANCDKKIAESTGEELRRYQDARAFLEALRGRITTSLDLMSGHAFTIKYDAETLEVFKPEPSLGKLLKAAEEAGAKVKRVISPNWAKEAPGGAGLGASPRIYSGVIDDE